MYLPDTNIFIQASRGSEKETEFLKQIIGQGKVVLSVIVVAEFLAGVTDDEIAKKDFYDILEQFKVIGINREVAEIASFYRKQSLKLNRINMLDCFLAAQAKKYNLTLVTNNTTDFPMKDIKVMKPKR